MGLVVGLQLSLGTIVVVEAAAAEFEVPPC